MAIYQVRLQKSSLGLVSSVASKTESSYDRIQVAVGESEIMQRENAIEKWKSALITVNFENNVVMFHGERQNH